MQAIWRFCAFLAWHAPAGDDPASIGRPLLERYLAGLSSSGLSPGTCLQHVSALNGFFRDARRHSWDGGALPAAATFYPEDYPKPGWRLPRAVAEHIMAQVEAPASLDRWANPSYRLITLILIRCGLRITDACKLPADCVVTDADGAPYLRYCNHKMRREALVPIDEELAGQIAVQRHPHRPAGHQRVTARQAHRRSGPQQTARRRERPAPPSAHPRTWRPADPTRSATPFSRSYLCSSSTLLAMRE